MNIKISEQILSIPPFLSTTWCQIASLHMQNDILFVTLIEGNVVQVPQLSSSEISSIFNYHAEFILKAEKEEKEMGEFSRFSQLFDQLNPPSLQFGFSTSFENNGEMFLGHNPDHADAPDLPKEILQKISLVTKMIASSSNILINEPQFGCNCFYCQISREIGENDTKQVDFLEGQEVVSDEDLHFEEWVIQETEAHLFSVTNKLDENERYQVFLGDPVGCTCGKEGCEHILAVLKS